MHGGAFVERLGFGGGYRGLVMVLGRGVLGWPAFGVGEARGGRWRRPAGAVGQCPVFL